MIKGDKERKRAIEKLNDKERERKKGGRDRNCLKKQPFATTSFICSFTAPLVISDEPCNLNTFQKNFTKKNANFLQFLVVRARSAC